MKNKKTITLLSFGHMASHWYMGVFMVILPLIRQDFSLSFTALGLLAAFRSLAGAAGNTISGVIVDLLGKPYQVLTLSTAGLILAWFSAGFANSYFLLLLIFPLATLFSNLWHAPAMGALSEAYPEKRGLALGIHGAAANLGQGISPLLIGFLITSVGWRTTLKAHIAPGALLVLLLILGLQGLKTLEFKERTGAAFWELVKTKLFKNKALFFISLVSALRTMGQKGIETYLPLFFAEKLGLDTVGVGFYLSILAFSATFPEPLIGWLSDRVGRRLILWTSLFFSGFSVIAITLVPRGAPLLVCVALFGWFHYSLRPIIFAYALDVTPPEISATTVSYVFTWNQAVSALAPLIGGFLADAFGVQYALYLVASLSFTSAIIAGVVKLGTPVERP